MAIEEGKPAPAFSLEDAAGKSVSLGDFAGKHVILYFYPEGRHARLHQGGLRLPRRLEDDPEARRRGDRRLARRRRLAPEVRRQVQAPLPAALAIPTRR